MFVLPPLEVAGTRTQDSSSSWIKPLLVITHLGDCELLDQRDGEERRIVLILTASSLV